MACPDATAKLSLRLHVRNALTTGQAMWTMVIRHAFCSSIFIFVLTSCSAGFSDRKEERCAAAEGIVGPQIDRDRDLPIVFRTDAADLSPYIDEESLPQFKQASWWKVTESPQSDGAVEEIHVSATDLELLQELVREEARNAVAECRSIRELLSKENISFGDKAIAAIETNGLSGLNSATAAYLSLPIVSEDGKTAIAYTSSVSGALAAGGQLWKLEKDSSGHWEKVGLMGLWIS